MARHQENVAILDRDTAFRLNGTPAPNLPTTVIDLTDDAPRNFMRHLSTLNSTLPEVIDLTPPPVLKLRQKLRQIHKQQNEEDIIGVLKVCAACQEPVVYFAAVYAPCGHDYCKDCIRQLFFGATRDESLFPPRCCRKAIPMASAQVFFTEEFVAYFSIKAVEWTTLNRTYCAWITCAAFIPPANIKLDTAVCSRCFFHTCIHCKNHAHEGRDCPQDPALQGLEEVARQAGWQRCFRCGRFVELILGCNHMTYVSTSLSCS